MSAADTIRELAAIGIRLSVAGDRLHVEARHGAVTDELRQRLVENKPELLAALRLEATRIRLLTIARSIGLPDQLVLELPIEEVEAAAEQTGLVGDDEAGRCLLTFYLRSLAGIEPERSQ